MNKKASIVALTITTAMAGDSLAAVYDESVDGELNRLNQGPTFFDVDLGTNSVSGTVGGFGNGDSSDFIAFTIDPGESLTSVVLTEYIRTGNSTSSDFDLYVDQGSGFVLVDDSSINGALLGRDYLNDPLPTDGTAPLAWQLGGLGPAPLGPGTYGIFIGENVEGQQYAFDLTVVPEPGSGDDGIHAIWVEGE